MVVMLVAFRSVVVDTGGYNIPNLGTQPGSIQ